jgi:hypothetical protein
MLLARQQSVQLSSGEDKYWGRKFGAFPFQLYRFISGEYSESELKDHCDLVYKKMKSPCCCNQLMKDIAVFAADYEGPQDLFSDPEGKLICHCFARGIAEEWHILRSECENSNDKMALSRMSRGKQWTKHVSDRTLRYTVHNHAKNGGHDIRKKGAMPPQQMRDYSTSHPLGGSVNVRALMDTESDISIAAVTCPHRLSIADAPNVQATTPTTLATKDIPQAVETKGLSGAGYKPLFEMANSRRAAARMMSGGPLKRKEWVRIGAEATKEYPDMSADAQKPFQEAYQRSVASRQEHGPVSLQPADRKPKVFNCGLGCGTPDLPLKPAAVMRQYALTGIPKLDADSVDPTHVTKERVSELILQGIDDDAF